MKDFLIFMITRLFLIRHGEVDSPGTFNGHGNVQLSSTGQAQMVNMAEDMPIVDIVASSDLDRCITGANLIAQKQNIKHIIDENLREMNFGSWDGLTANEIEKKFPNQWKEFLEDIFSVKPEGGETYGETASRVLKVFHQLLEDHKGRRIALISHGGVIRILINEALNLGADIFKITQSFAGVNVLDYHEETIIIQRINGTSAKDL